MIWKVQITAQSDLRPTPINIESILSDFQGVIQQAPPAFSAIKIDGERAYDLARAGETVEMAERPVTIEKLGSGGLPGRRSCGF